MSSLFLLTFFIKNSIFPLKSTYLNKDIFKMKDDNVFLGLSAFYKKMRNYDDLDTYGIKDDSLVTSAGIACNSIKVNPKGYE